MAGRTSNRFFFMDVHQRVRNNRALLTSLPSPRRINLFGAFLFCFTFYSAKRSWLGNFRVSLYSRQTDAQRVKRRWQFFSLSEKMSMGVFFFCYLLRALSLDCPWILYKSKTTVTKSRLPSLIRIPRCLYGAATTVLCPGHYITSFKILWRRHNTISSKKPGYYT